ncbi:biotin--[acetyl-CoA-carboxylase] ligase [Ketogulonicigenium vulgare]|nr:biotin--[acetyl-CoA-carboxylase] ligase [Ketogulonicigenium vulgare]ADO43362.1 biotin--acetyl-CoA-carboxylase ligase [Ketogulonicigenium vulgare Y25]ALJ81761.1 biotin--acetyl-CoA-carboxylase ligase [Ketogulonicigenium vulgare]ANW34421.1 biotin--[acetyl-CoA-carboxylase] ligase [Ketogulonicigenium vulgare]AOZ55398.1 biotin--acetyl-CoA-carboxylase ligase [Ketogulonicigenium vulgare]
MFTDPDWPAGVDRIIFDSIDSTMLEARRQLALGLTRPLWILAHDQTAGHGRRGRAWTHPAGNFAGTVVFRPGGTPHSAGLRSFLMSNALRTALSAFVDPARLGLKWPNDVLLDGGKIAGILLESSAQGAAVDWLAIGVGVNLAMAPDSDGAAFAPVALGAHPPHPEVFLTHLARAFAAQEAIFATDGFAPIRNEWLKHAVMRGKTITARLPNVTYEGRFDGIDDDGNLMLTCADGPRTIAAAEVHFGPAPHQP